VAKQILIGRITSKYYYFIGLVCIIGVLTYASCSSTSESFQYLNHASDVAYVGIEKCASCHKDKHLTFQHTGMGMSFDSATKEKSVALFGPHQSVYDSFSGYSYYPFWSDSQLYIKEYKVENEEIVYSQNVKVDYIVGSGQHTNSHLIMENGYLFQAPITFYVQDQKWDLAPGFEGGNNSRFERMLDVECVSCHNSMPQLKESSTYKFTSIGKGIDCERCHGPGELHVQEREAGLGVDVNKETDPTIVNPGKLSLERQIDVCQRCHLQGLNILKPNKKFTDFKPGMVLSDVFNVYLPEYEGNQEELDMANHAERFQMSQCFVSSRKHGEGFTCITCHNPHISVNQTEANSYNAACITCHKTKLCSANPDNLKAEKNNCVKCHMPKVESEDILHVAIHDHYIRKPIAPEKVNQVKTLIGLYAVNNSNPNKDEIIKAYLEYWEKFDKNPFYINKAKALLNRSSPKDLWLKYYYLNEEYEKAIKLDFNKDALQQLSSWDMFMLGVCFEKTKRQSQAIYYLEKSFKADPTNLNIGSSLLKNYIAANSIQEAGELARYLEKEFPRNAIIKTKYARVLILENRYEEAKTKLDEAYRYAPELLEVWEGHLNLSIRQGRGKEIFYWAGIILEKYPNHANRKELEQILSEYQ
jgi:tetratricopeptide (TPR) repeat protein